MGEIVRSRGFPCTHFQQPPGLSPLIGYVATTLAYSSFNILALPVDSAYAARDVEYDEARNVGISDVVDYSTRDLHDMFLEACGYDNDGLDARE